MIDDFKHFIKILGRGKKGTRSLTSEEAQLAMQMILNNQALPEQIGAFWMLIRIREETVAETVGFTRAVREFLAQNRTNASQVDIDWPAYAGKRNELPWFLLSALTLAQAGYKVAMHGHSFDEENRIYVQETIQWLGLSSADTIQEAEKNLEQGNFTYVPLNAISTNLAELMDLKLTLGLRSPVNTVVRMMNPFNAKHSVHGVFHKGYDELHLDAAEILKDPSVAVFRGGNGEAEVNPERDVTVGFLKGNTNQVPDWQTWNKAEQQHVRQKDNLDPIRLLEHWSGSSEDAFGQQAVLQTLTVVVMMLFPDFNREQALKKAEVLWQQRDKQCFKRTQVA
ncbi:glycosyl transferase family protein [Marinomonas mediterranea]|jgi:Anthranilate phosphoribosyltransferase|uniref:Glycosyl transferase, family 3 n=1 Tax=Marinomonas mediterranea (strain ATCC 700492 / JCM 21426 / NBRC 103028 / MMB-1) TaxID=717774 RepID=F2JXS4_MARM1|nr:glycosyl transferase family protein [Marinomonas mediterranea]ADZ93072.1 Glycosyl transferase, family 3 [Marinomonas mediterranea MMB-1]WCN15040.1 glycosyl transferase family protein [Marinomonas mediterranea]WCN19084.1 glycosyl transferase family protein [Marinomonas mediterranea MMB-1]